MKKMIYFQCRWNNLAPLAREFWVCYALPSLISVLINSARNSSHRAHYKTDDEFLYIGGGCYETLKTQRHAAAGEWCKLENYVESTFVWGMCQTQKKSFKHEIWIKRRTIFVFCWTVLTLKSLESLKFLSIHVRFVQARVELSNTAKKSF